MWKKNSLTDTYFHVWFIFGVAKSAAALLAFSIGEYVIASKTVFAQVINVPHIDNYHGTTFFLRIFVRSFCLTDAKNVTDYSLRTVQVLYMQK